MGRLVVRKSGTEPVIRVMAEGEDEEMVAAVVDEICAVIRGRHAGPRMRRRRRSRSEQAAE